MSQVARQKANVSSGAPGVAQLAPIAGVAMAGVAAGDIIPQAALAHLAPKILFLPRRWRRPHFLRKAEGAADKSSPSTGR